VRIEVDELEDKIESLENRVKQARANGSTPPNHIDKLRRWNEEITTLQALLISPRPAPRPASRSEAPVLHAVDEEDEEEEVHGEGEEEAEEEDYEGGEAEEDEDGMS